MGVIDFRAAARTDGGVSSGRFQRKTKVDDRGNRAIVQQAIQRAKEGDSEALRFLYVRYADNVYGYVTSIVRDEHEAEDITQQVFTKLITVLPRYEQRDVPFSAWILRLAPHVAGDHLRARPPTPTEDPPPTNARSDQTGHAHGPARRPTPTEDPRPTNVRSDQTGHEYGRSLRQALGELPEDQRTVVVMRHVVGLSPTEIAAQMGKTESSVHGLPHRARGTLRRALAPREGAPATGSPPRAREEDEAPAVLGA